MCFSRDEICVDRVHLHAVNATKEALRREGVRLAANRDEFRQALETACDLLSEFGAWDSINETDNPPVVEFLRSDELRDLQA